MREKLLDLMKNEGLKPSQLAEPVSYTHLLHLLPDGSVLP